MIRTFLRRGWIIQVLLLSLGATHASWAQPDYGPFAGMWSDPPHTAEGMLCFAVCTDAGIALLDEKLDDPVNDDVAYEDLVEQVDQESIGGLLFPLLTDFSRPGFPMSFDEDAGFLRCEPPGLAWQIFQPHQLEFTVHEDRIQMRYGEWDARRTVWTDGRAVPPGQRDSLLGYSQGRMEGDTLVITTSHVEARTLLFLMNHSNQLQAEERYTISADGQMLTLYVTFTDPVALSGPVTLKKIWSWSPDEVIYPYVDCEIPTDYLDFLGDDE
jgi:hypothetical protein